MEIEEKSQLDTELVLTSIEQHLDTIRSTNKSLTAALMDLTTDDGMSYGIVTGNIQHILESLLTILDKFETVDLMVFRHELDKLVFTRSVPEKSANNDQ